MGIGSLYDGKFDFIEQFGGALVRICFWVFVRFVLSGLARALDWDRLMDDGNVKYYWELDA